MKKCAKHFLFLKKFENLSMLGESLMHGSTGAPEYHPRGPGLMKDVISHERNLTLKRLTNSNKTKKAKKNKTDRKMLKIT